METISALIWESGTLGSLHSIGNGMSGRRILRKYLTGPGEQSEAKKKPKDG